MTDLRHAPVRPADPISTAEAAATLLRTGRTAMALTLLGELPEAIRAAIAAAKPALPSPTQLQLEAAELARLRAEARSLVADIVRLRSGRRQAEAEAASRRRELAKLEAMTAKKRRALERLSGPPSPPAEPRPPKPHELLAEALASGRVTAERVAELLRLRPGDVAPIAEGRVGLARTAWRRLLKELAA